MIHDTDDLLELINRAMANATELLNNGATDAANAVHIHVQTLVLVGMLREVKTLADVLMVVARDGEVRVHANVEGIVYGSH